MYLLRCSVSGGLEDFAEQEVRRLLMIRDSNNGSVTIRWHHRGHSGSLLDIRCESSGQQRDEQELLSQTLLAMISNLRFVEYVALRVLSKEITMNITKSSKSTNDDASKTVLDWITEQCNQLQHGALDAAIDAWTLWQPSLDAALPVHSLDGILVPFPADFLGSSSDDHPSPSLSPMATTTTEFRVNTIFTKPHVAQGVVHTFVDLVQKELDCSDNTILWLDAGAGSGSLLREFPPDASTVGVDLDPRHPSILKSSFFDITEDWLTMKLSFSFQHLCIISNPPFSEGNRGDYSSIAKFVGYARRLPKCRFMGVIVPAKFSRVWKSFGELSSCSSNHPVELQYRMVLPEDSFYDPSTNESKNIECHFLIFDLQPTTTTTPSLSSHDLMETEHNSQEKDKQTIHVVAQRDKGMFPSIATAQLTSAVVGGLGRAGVSLGSSKTSTITLRAKLANRLELFLDLNPKRPLSVVNAVSARVDNHSLGWMAKSVRPPVALAMHSLSKKRGLEKLPGNNTTTPAVGVNLMCGEGTLEFESVDPENCCYFQISGDKNPETINRVASQVRLLDQAPLVDFVLWDAQHLPLRDGIANSILGDLPFAGSTKKSHQEPTTGDHTRNKDTSLSYPQLLAESVRVLCHSTGTAVLVSPDTKSLVHAIKKYSGNFKELWQTKINIGGIAGRLCMIERKERCWKDLNLLVEDAKIDFSSEMLARAKKACSRCYLDRLLSLHEDGKEKPQHLILSVDRHSEYYHKDGTTSQCYRFCFHANITNVQAKSLEKIIRLNLLETPIKATKM